MKYKRLTTKEKGIFANEIAIILSSGMSIYEGLELIAPELPNEHMRHICIDLLNEYQSKGKFYDALKASQVFDQYMEEMVKIGEESGNLDDVMHQLALYYERNDDMQMQIKDAITYPLILMVMMLVVIGVFVLKILPIFQNVLHNVGTSLSPLAQTLMDFGQNFALIAFIILSVLALMIILFLLYTKISKDKTLQEHLLAKCVMTKKLYTNISMANITYALSLFLSSGYPIEEAVKFLPNFVNHPKLKIKLQKIIMKMEAGTSFADAIKVENLYTGVYANMLQIGFKSGKQDEVLKKLVQLYEKDVAISISNFLNIIEPSIVALLSLVVGIILLSVMLPLMSIMSSLG
ncbi:MAG: type II secretion system F family protein [Erysipelotrichia bacterium]|nr:type II secretion system F family protein [Erysipelotrichia bacterium]NCC54431.1 type II secretion system F family protein [Erysipelotrichia bacterium]